MVVFEVKINGQVVSVAGAGEYGFLFTDVMWNRRNPVLRPKGMSKKSWDEVELKLRTTGGTLLDSATGEHLRWAAKPLSVGDKIVIRILEQPKCDEPIERERYDRAKPTRRAAATRMRTKRALRRKAARR